MLWLARHMERVENIARTLQVTQLFSRNRRDDDQWRSLVAINADEQRFAEVHGKADAESVTRFYLVDGDNPTSARATLRGARENARTLRALISNEMWTQLNVLHGWLAGLTDADIAPDNLSAVLDALRLGCQTHTGITEGTFYRDQGRRFYTMGRYLERADQITRLLDVRFRAPDPVGAGGMEYEQEHWSVLLRATAAYHAYRRLHPSGFSAEEVVAFLLLDESFPRSISLALGRIMRSLDELTVHDGIAAAEGPYAFACAVRGELRAGALSADLAALPKFLDWAQLRIGALHGEIAKAFFPAGEE
jgi:uncharacterized alpha-E superfamily protein